MMLFLWCVGDLHALDGDGRAWAFVVVAGGWLMRCWIWLVRLLG